VIYRQFTIRPSALGRKYGFVLHNRTGQYLTWTETETAARGLVDAWWDASSDRVPEAHPAVEDRGPMTYRQFTIDPSASGHGLIIRNSAGHFVCTAPDAASAWCLIDQWWEQPD
jgi:hypothetical protein